MENKRTEELIIFNYPKLTSQLRKEHPRDFLIIICSKMTSEIIHSFKPISILTTSNGTNITYLKISEYFIDFELMKIRNMLRAVRD